MRVAVLISNEALKARKRLSIWVTWLAFVGILAVVLGGMYYASRAAETAVFGLPGAWNTILALAPLSAFFSAVAVILLTASEFSWKTARQNVIDGLSKEEWFAGKLMIAIAVAVVFDLTLIAAGGGLALTGTSGAGWSGWVRRADLMQAVGGGLLVVGYATMALFAAFLARSAGAAMGLFFLYAAILEQLVRGAFSRIGGVWQEVARVLPMSVFGRLTDSANYDAAERAQTIQLMADAGREAGLWPLWLLWGGALAWIGAFSLAALWIHRHRDL